MNRSSNKGKTQSVCGLLEPELLGVTNTHEHLLIDLRKFALSPAEASSKDLYQRSIDLNVLGYLDNHALPNADNYFLSKISTAIDEVTLYKEYGGNSIVDVTSVGLGRDPIGLHRISRSTGVNIVMGSSYYVDTAHPLDIKVRSEDELVEEIVNDITNGVGNTGVKAGVIGEVG